MNKITPSGILVSSQAVFEASFELRGSFYKALLKRLGNHLEKYGDWNWLINCLTKETLKASQVEDLVEKHAKIFKNLGFEPKDGIHLVVGNHNYNFLAVFATWYLGGFASCGDINLDHRAIESQIKDTGAKIVICVPETAQKVLKAIENSQVKPKILCYGQFPGCINLLEKIENMKAQDFIEVYDDVQDAKKALAIVLWSSGTTGNPKGICHSHFSVWNLIAPFINKDNANFEKVYNNVTTTCFFHGGGFITGIKSILQRQSFYHMFGKEFNLKVLLLAIKEAQPEVINLGPHLYVELSESDIFQVVSPQDVACITKIFPVGSAVPAICQSNLKKMFQNLSMVINAYGQTEAGMVTFGFSNEHLGFLAEEAQIKIVHPDSGLICGPGEIGEICIKTPTMMIGYLKRPQETKEYFEKDGFGRSGDLGYFDENGRIFYIDRVKELIKYCNNHVSPTEIEAILQTHPNVEKSLVFGKKCPQVQELISAVIVAKKGSVVTAEELRTFVNEKVIDFKKLRGDIIFQKEIPHNSVGKLLRREMRQWAEKLQKTQ